MKIYTEIIGNIHQSPEWEGKLKEVDVEYVYLDQWVAQKSRFLAKGDKGNEYPVAMKRHTQVVDGDVIYFAPDEKKAVVIRIELSPVLVIDMGALARKEPEAIIRISVELGHAIGNQHWPAVVKGTRVYVPLTVDKKVMLSVMETHHIEGITYEFQKGMEVIPYLAPHEIRRLFGGAGQESHAHTEGHNVVLGLAHEHSHGQDHEHGYGHGHGECGCGHSHSHEHEHGHGNCGCGHSHSH